jgi:hypothetical protein
MLCPKCGKENHIGAIRCFYCRCTLPQDSSLVPRVSRLGITSCILGLFTILPFFIMLVAPPSRRHADIGAFCILVFLAASLTAVIFGLIALAWIGLSGGRLTGPIFPLAGILTPAILLGLSLLFALPTIPRSTAYRMVCGTNLSGMGKAMLIYANDYDDKLPRAGSTDSVWTGRVLNWAAPDREKAFGLDKGNGQVSITSSLYLLVKYGRMTPKSFVCTKDRGTKQFDPAKYGITKSKLAELWDFGPNPAKHCSYSYHVPYGRFALTTNCDPRLAVAADRNPWQPSPFAKPKDFKRFSLKDRESVIAGNARMHINEGQNVLFLDSHVEFEKTSACGIDDDNIYTYQTGSDIRIGTPPVIGSQPTAWFDSLLVTDGDPAKSKD